MIYKIPFFHRNVCECVFILFAGAATATVQLTTSRWARWRTEEVPRLTCTIMKKSTNLRKHVCVYRCKVRQCMKERESH